MAETKRYEILNRGLSLALAVSVICSLSDGAVSDNRPEFSTGAKP
jgi:hypothetical protein